MGLIFKYLTIFLLCIVATKYLSVVSLALLTTQVSAEIKESTVSGKIEVQTLKDDTKDYTLTVTLNPGTPIVCFQIYHLIPSSADVEKYILEHHEKEAVLNGFVGYRSFRTYFYVSSIKQKE